MENILEEKEKKIEELEKHIHQLKLVIACGHKDVMTVYEFCVKSVENARKNWDVTQKNLEERLESQKMNNALLKSEINSLRSEVDKNLLAYHNLKAECDIIKMSRDHYRIQYKESVDEINQLKNQFNTNFDDQLERITRNIQHECLVLQERMDEKTNKISELENQVQCTSEIVSDRDREINHLKRQLEDKDKENELLNRENHGLQVEVEELRGQLEQLLLSRSEPAPINQDRQEGAHDVSCHCNNVIYNEEEHQTRPETEIHWLRTSVSSRRSSARKSCPPTPDFLYVPSCEVLGPPTPELVLPLSSEILGQPSPDLSHPRIAQSSRQSSPDLCRPPVAQSSHQSSPDLSRPPTPEIFYKTPERDMICPTCEREFTQALNSDDKLRNLIKYCKLTGIEDSVIKDCIRSGSKVEQIERLRILLNQYGVVGRVDKKKCRAARFLREKTRT